jgi:hypothetical protein
MPHLTHREKAILDAVNQRLDSLPAGGPPLKISGSRWEEDWLYVAVVPSRPDVRALDHAEAMSRIERELRREGFDNVLLVPALEEDKAA